MFACAFASCSSDDDNSNPVVTPEGDGVAEIMVNPDLLRGNIKSKAFTKADVDPTVYDNYIVYVFNRATGANLGHGTPGVKFEVKNNPGAVDVMVVGNVAKELDGSEARDAVLAVTKEFDETEEKGETAKDGNAVETTSQSSHLYPFTLQSGMINKVGYSAGSIKDGEYLLADYKIQLYRHVAKVVLNKITVDVKKIDENGKEVIYSNPNLSVDRVFILNAQNSTKLAAEARWGTVFNNGVVMGSVELAQFNDWMTEAGKLTTDKTKPYIPVAVPKTDATYKIHATYNSETDNIKGEISKEKIFTTDNVFYVYESTDIKNATLLVVEGDFSYDNPEDNTKPRIKEHGYYTVQLGVGTLSQNLSEDLFPGVGDDMGVRRNIQYNVNLIVRAPGSKNPLIPNTKVGYLDTQIELVGYGEVSSDSTFE